MKRIKISKQCWEVDHNFCWDQKKVVNREKKLNFRKIKEAIRSFWRILIILTKFPTCFLKYNFLIYGSSLFIYVTSVDSN